MNHTIFKLKGFIYHWYRRTKAYIWLIPFLASLVLLPLYWSMNGIGSFWAGLARLTIAGVFVLIVLDRIWENDK